MSQTGAEARAEQSARYYDRKVSDQIDREAAEIVARTGMSVADARSLAIQAMINRIRGIE